MPGSGFDYRPESRKWTGEKMPEYPPDAKADKAYEFWRQDMVHQLYRGHGEPTNFTTPAILQRGHNR